MDKFEEKLQEAILTAIEQAKLREENISCKQLLEVIQAFPRSCLSPSFLEDVWDLIFTIKNDILIHSVADMLENANICTRFLQPSRGQLLFKLQEIIRSLSATVTVSYGLLQITLRVLLQMLQTVWFERNRRVITASKNLTEKEVNALQETWNTLLNLLQNDKCLPDCSMMAGTVMAIILHLIPNIQQAVGLFMETLVAFADDELEGPFSKLPMVETEFYSNNKVVFWLNKLQGLNSVAKSRFLPTLSLLHGLLASRHTEVLLWRIENHQKELLGDGQSANQYRFDIFKNGHDKTDKQNESGDNQKEGRIAPYDSLLIQVFPLIIQVCTPNMPFPFHAFQTLSLWLQVVVEHINLLHFRKDDTLDQSPAVFTYSSAVMQKLLPVIELNWDHPVKGISGFVNDAFTSVLDGHRRECILLNTDSGELIGSWINKYMQDSWNDKRKYLPLAALAGHYGAVKLVTEHPSLCKDLLASLKSNPVAAAASTFYLSLLQGIGLELRADEKSAIALWSQHFQEPLVGALCDKNSIVQQNALRHWLPATLQVFPESHQALIAALKERTDTAALYSGLNVYSLCRKRGIASLDDMDASIVELSLQHPDDNIRVQAFQVVCVSHKSSAPLSELELRFLKMFLPNNLAVDSAAFRQLLVLHFRALVARVRDACLAQLTGKNIPTDLHNINLQQGIDFVDWMWSLLITNLVPGANFQRRQTCLDLLMVILESLFNFCKKRKGAVPVKTVKLIETAQAEGKWQFFSSFNIILSCTLDYMPEIQKAACSILQRCFDWPNNNHDVSVTSLLTSALELCSSPKTCDVQAGAVLIKLIFKRCLVEGAESDIQWNSPTEFLKFLRDKLVEQKTQAQSDFLLASRHNPIHGLVLALRLCLSACTELCTAPEHQEALVLFSEELVTLNQELVELVLNTLTADTEHTPSFADMSQAIESIIRNTGANDLYREDDAALSIEHQLVLACCWLTLKECCMLLVEMTKSLVAVTRPQTDGSPGFCLTPGTARRVGSIIVTVLARCRHRGAIEAAQLAMVQYCRVLMVLPVEELSSIPGTILDRVLDEMTKMAASTSTTRRSAGIALLVQAVVSAEPPGHKPILRRTMERLQQMVTVPVGEGLDEKVDLPPAQGLHILRALLHDASLSVDSLTYIPQILALCIHMFASPYWSVRNAALQLYGALVPKLLGQKKVREDDCEHNTMAASELFHRYPAIRSVLLSALSLSAVSHLTTASLHCSALLPVLSFLARLTPGNNAADDSSLSELVSVCISLLRSAVISVRKATAAAIVTMATNQEMSRVTSDTLRILGNQHQQQNYNQLHGSLLLLKGVCRSHHWPSGDVGCAAVLDAIKWLSTEQCSSPLVRSLAVEVLTLVADNPTTIPDPGPAGSQSWQPGHAVLRQSLMKLKLLKAEVEGPKAVLTLILGVIGSTTADCCLEELSTGLQFMADFTGWGSLPLLSAQCQNGLISLTSNTTLPPSLLRNALDILGHIQDQVCVESDASSEQSYKKVKVSSLKASNDLYSEEYWKVLQTLAQQSKGLEVAASAMCILAKIVRWRIEHWNSDWSDDVSWWSETLLTYCESGMCETLRLSCSRCLQLAGPTIIYSAARHTRLQLPMIRVIRAAWLLLEDEDQEIRQPAAVFVALLRDNTQVLKEPGIQTVQAIELLCELVAEHCSWSEQTILYIWELLSNNTPSTRRALQAELYDKEFMLFEHDGTNVFTEPVIMLQRYHRLVQVMLRKNNVSAVTSGLEGTLNDAEDTLSFLRDLDGQALPAVWKSRPYLIIARLLCRLHVMADVLSSMQAKQLLADIHAITLHGHFYRFVNIHAM